MPNFSFLGPMAQGFDAGRSNGMGLKERALGLQIEQQKLDAQKRELAASAAMYSNIGGPQQGGQQQPPGGQQQGGVPQQMPMPGATPMPGRMMGPDAGMTGAPPPVPMQGGGAPPMQPPQMGGGMPQQMPGAMRPPMMGGQGPMPGGGGAPPMQGGGAPPMQPQQPQQQGAPVSGVARPSGNAYQDMQSTLRSIAQDIKSRNPNIDPLTLATAVEKTLGQMRGLEPVERASMMAEVQSARIQSQAETAMMKAENASEIAQIKAEAAAQVAQIRAEAARSVAGTNAGARMGAARVGAGARVQSAQIGATSRENVAGTNAASRERVAGTNAGARDRSSEAGYRGRVDGAAVGMGKKPVFGSSGGSGSSSLPRVKSKADYDKLKKGQQFLDPEGNTRTKG